jgi:hypothetical protein
VGIYIKNKLFLEVDSLSQKGILILNNFHLSKAIRVEEKTFDGVLRNTIPKCKVELSKTQTHKPMAKL